MRSISAALAYFALFLLATCVAACKSNSSGEKTPAFRDVSRGYDSGIDARGLVIAPSREEWSKLWNRHASRTLQKPKEPEVDWSREMVVGVLAGERPTAGHAVHVERVVREKDRVVLEVVETRPSKDAFVPQVITHPYHFVAIERTDLPIELVWK